MDELSLLGIFVFVSGRFWMEENGAKLKTLFVVFGMISSGGAFEKSGNGLGIEFVEGNEQVKICVQETLKDLVLIWVGILRVIQIHIVDFSLFLQNFQPPPS